MTSADLRAWRARNRLTQAKAAKAIGFSVRGLQAAEAREGELTTKMTLAIEGYEARRREAVIDFLRG